MTTKKQSNRSKNNRLHSKKEKHRELEEIFINQNLEEGIADNLQTENNNFQFNNKTTQTEINQSNKTETTMEDFNSGDINQNKYVAAFAYFPFLFLIPLLLKRESFFCQKHAKQGLVWFAFLLISAVCYWIPGVNILYAFMVLIITFNTVLQTLNGKYWRIPILYKWAEKINL